MARYRLHDRAAPELVTNNYKARIAWLRDVASGKASLGLASDSLAPAGAGLPEMTSGGRVFAREDLD
jgi:phage gp36-like protein